MTPDADPLSLLDAADPETAEQVRAALEPAESRIDPARLEAIAADTVAALSLEISFGRAVGAGLAALATDTPAPLWERYRKTVRNAADRGATYGRHIAEILVPVIRSGNPALLDRFLDTVQILAAKGTYTFPRTFEGLSRLLAAGDVVSAEAYLELLAEAFYGQISYNRSLQLTVAIPLGVRALSPDRRHRQIRRLIEICRTDKSLIEPFFEGIEKGLDLLSEAALADFTEKGLSIFHEHPNRGRRFFSLESKLGADACAERQVTAALFQMQEPLNRYLRARLGGRLAVLPLSALSRAMYGGPPDAVSFFSDSRAIYLPATIRAFPRRSDNVRLYKALTRLEAGHHEFGTHDFDLEKADARLGATGGRPKTAAGVASGLERFCSRFSPPELAMDLFFIFEQGRVWRCAADRYPGLVRTVYPLLAAEFDRCKSASAKVLNRLYEALVLNRPAGKDDLGRRVSRWAALFDKQTAADDSVETSAVITGRIFAEAARLVGADAAPDRPCRPFDFPFGHRLRPDLVAASDRQAARTADQIKAAVEKSGRYRVYRSDLVRLLRNRTEPIQREALEKIIVRIPGRGSNDVDPAEIDLDPWLPPPDGVEPSPEETGGPVFWYPEWDSRLEDYLQRHVRVKERVPHGDAGEFYAEVLRKKRHLVRRIRTAFEMLRPEGLKILRQWIEGDAFDHRALIDFAVDRRAGQTPSDRLYIKRLKQERDIGVLLLVDLSRSTANRVAGSPASVLDVEKEALVLFCEALGIVGDAFAVAGFSGTGRLGVDYFPIKDFEGENGADVRGRIGALSPQRSTRMGAAIRHATARLEALACHSRLLLILGDGFPNDADYKQGYAIGDTRKAISEARAKQIHVRAITVNLPADPKLDDLYGNVHHTVISEVRELPDRLLRIYSSLTRC